MLQTFATALALVLVIEGIGYILFPEKIKAMMAKMQHLPTQNLRTAGLILAVFGLLCIWVIEYFI